MCTWSASVDRLVIWLEPSQKKKTRQNEENFTRRLILFYIEPAKNINQIVVVALD